MFVICVFSLLTYTLLFIFLFYWCLVILLSLFFVHAFCTLVLQIYKKMLGSLLMHLVALMGFPIQSNLEIQCDAKYGWQLDTTREMETYVDIITQMCSCLYDTSKKVSSKQSTTYHYVPFGKLIGLPIMFLFILNLVGHVMMHASIDR